MTEVVPRFLIIQTAFIGDAILVSSLLESLHRYKPEMQLDLVVRKGNEALFDKHPYIRRVFVWNKREKKYRNLFRLISDIRKEGNYERVICLQRFAAAGFMTLLIKAKQKVGFKKNPFSFAFTNSFPHEIGNGDHETQRNFQLIADLPEVRHQRPRLYPTEEAFAFVKQFQQSDYICIAPTSVWFTKQFPKHRWIEFINSLDPIKVYLIGAPGDAAYCDDIIHETSGIDVENLCGKLNFLQSTALMSGAKMNYVNDSAPLHLCSAIDAPVRAIFCSTSKDFGFTPLSNDSEVIEVRSKLSCRPCGLHGKKACPEGHFACGEKIDIQELLNPLKDAVK